MYVVFVQALLMPRSNNSSGVTAQNTFFFELLACLAQPTYPIPDRCRTDTAEREAFEPPPKDVFHSFKPCTRQAKQTNAQALDTSSNRNAREYGIRPSSRRCAERTRLGEGCWSRPPKTALERSYLTENSSSANRILRPRRKKLLTESLKQRMIL